ncbi:hypothetical protein Droror1_Dr00004803 [Drosera rotundifolia]
MIETTPPFESHESRLLITLTVFSPILFLVGLPLLFFLCLCRRRRNRRRKIADRERLRRCEEGRGGCERERDEGEVVVEEEEEDEEEEKGWLLERYLEDQWSLVAKLCDWGGDDDDGAGDWCRGDVWDYGEIC